MNKECKWALELQELCLQQMKTDLLITEILPNNIEKAIYLDCDIISELRNVSVDSYLAGYVNLSNNYFNLGEMLLNLY